MKKVKAMLAGIAVLAVVGGAFAFKARTAFSSTVYTSTTSSPLNGCTVKNVNSTIADPVAQNFYYTISPSGICVTTTVVDLKHKQ